MFAKTFAMESANFFLNEGRTEGLLCKNIGILLNYEEVGFYL